MTVCDVKERLTVGKQGTTVRSRKNSQNFEKQIVLLGMNNCTVTIRIKLLKCG